VRARELLRALRFVALVVPLCAVKRFALEVLYSLPGIFDLFGDDIGLRLFDGALGAAQELA
jgi:hypothetical protein